MREFGARFGIHKVRYRLGMSQPVVAVATDQSANACRRRRKQSFIFTPFPLIYAKIKKKIDQTFFVNGSFIILQLIDCIIQRDTLRGKSKQTTDGFFKIFIHFYYVYFSILTHNELTIMFHRLRWILSFENITDSMILYRTLLNYL